MVILTSAASDGGYPYRTMRNWLADFGERLIANGYPIIPIMPGAKCPGRFTRGQWTGYPDWSRHCLRMTKPFELGIWRQWPGASLGVPCGQFVAAVDIDLTIADAADKIANLARAELGDTPCIRFGQAPKRLLVYRAAELFKPVKRHPIEVLANGSQFVAYGIHPGTQAPYAWPVEELADIPLMDLPAITEVKARAFADAAFELVPPEMRRSTLGPDRSTEHYLATGGDLRGTVEAISDALAWVPNDDLHYDDWVKIGLAIKGALGEQGRDLFAEWSARSSKDVPNITLKTWSSLKPERIGAGSIYYYATQYGWVPAGDLILNAAVAERINEPHPAAPIIEQRHTPEPAAADPAHDPDPSGIVASAPGLLGELVDWMTSTAVSPQPFLSLGAALCAVGVVAGQRYRLVRPDTRSAVYVIALAESGGGKDHPRKCVRQLLGEAKLEQLLGGETLASGAAVMGSLAQHPVRLYQVDEFGHFVAAVLDPKAHAHHRREIMTNLTTLWSSADGLVVGTEYANKKDRPRRDIQEPCVCVYGSTVPQTFWGAMQSGNVTDGSLARFLIMQSERNFPDEREVPEDIGDRLFDLAERMKMLNECQGTGSIKTLPLSDKAEALDREIRAEQLEFKRANEGTQYGAVAARYREHIRRVALISAVADGSMACETRHLEWARDLVRHCVDGFISAADRYIADSEVEAVKKRVLEIVRQHGPLTMSSLVKRTQFLKSRDRQEVLVDLKEAGLISVQKLSSTGGRPTAMVSLV